MSALGSGSSRERLLGPALRTQPDGRLIALAHDGSEPALDEVVRRYRAPLVRYAGGIVGAAAAEDVVQEALAKALPALGRGAEVETLRPWLYTIVRNTGLNHLRDIGPATVELDESYDGVEQPPQALERREGLRALVGGLRRLPGQQREALVKRELEGRSHEEIGAELGVSKGAARQLVFRARESLRLGFGSLVPMPLLRWLAEGGAGDGAVGVAAGAGGSALAAKAAIAVLATGAAVGGAVAIDGGGGPPRGTARAEAAVRAGVDRGGTASGDASTQERAATGPAAAESSFTGSRRGDDSRRSEGHADGPSSNGPGGHGDDRRGGDGGRGENRGDGDRVGSGEGTEASGDDAVSGGGPGPSRPPAGDEGGAGPSSGSSSRGGSESGSRHGSGEDDSRSSGSGSRSGSSGSSGSSGRSGSGERSGPSGSGSSSGSSSSSGNSSHGSSSSGLSSGDSTTSSPSAAESGSSGGSSGSDGFSGSGGGPGPSSAPTADAVPAEVMPPVDSGSSGGSGSSSGSSSSGSGGPGPSSSGSGSSPSEDF